MGKKEIQLEDSALDDFSDGLEVVERPLSNGVFHIVAGIAVALVCVVAGKLIYTVIIHGGEYKQRAQANSGQEIVLKAPRGIIYDRYGTPLVTNQPTFHVTLNLSELFRDTSRIDATLNQIQEIVPFDTVRAKEEILKTDLERQAYYSVAQNIPLESVIALKKLQNRAVVIQNGFARTYVDAPAFAHVLGFTGLVSESDLKENTDLMLNDSIGKTGIEAQYDTYLRGVNGSTVQFQDAKGNAIGSQETHNPASGTHLYTTLDAELQKTLYTTLTDQLKQLGRHAGVGIAIDPQTGELLALVSVPSFDSNNLSADLFSDATNPTFNRALSGVYSPGSVIKPLVAFGALEEDVIDPLTSIYSAGYIELPNPYNPDHPSRFLDWKPQGWVNMYSALARSSNVYFYEVGGGFQKQKGLGIEKLHEYWAKFLLDKKTGIDLPGETVGSLPTVESKEARTGTPWRIGDTYNVSIGQGDLMITPIELIRYIAGVANKGKLPIPFVVQKAALGDAIKYERSAQYDSIETKDTTHFDEVELGMLAAVEKDFGTAYMLHDIPMVIAGKTGSAQIQNNAKTNAFVVAYAPVPNPRIALVVLIEDAKEGSLNAVPVAYKVMNWYYQNRVASSTKQ